VPPSLPRSAFPFTISSFRVIGPLTASSAISSHLLPNQLPLLVYLPTRYPRSSEELYCLPSFRLSSYILIGRFLHSARSRAMFISSRVYFICSSVSVIR